MVPYFLSEKMTFQYFIACLFIFIMSVGLVYYSYKKFGRKGFLIGGIVSGIIGYGIGSQFY